MKTFLIKSFSFLVVGAAMFAMGAATILFVWGSLFPARTKSLPDPPALVERVREVARLETLDVSVYKKVTYEPGPKPAGSFAGELASWAAYSWDPPQGKAIVFADVHLGFDLQEIDERSIRVDGDSVELVMPRLLTQVSLKPAETEIIRSNLEPAELMLLLDDAKFAIEREVAQDPAMRTRAETSAKNALRSLLLGAGFREVRFVEALPIPPPGM